MISVRKTATHEWLQDLANHGIQDAQIEEVEAAEAVVVVEAVGAAEAELVDVVEVGRGLADGFVYTAAYP